MLVQVTKADIRAGRAFLEGESTTCPVVIALRRALGRHVAVGDLIYVGDPPYPTERHQIPTDVAAWMVRFDAREKVGPFSFEWPPRSTT